jgi:hypothetical protein
VQHAVVHGLRHVDAVRFETAAVVGVLISVDDADDLLAELGRSLTYM